MIEDVCIYKIIFLYVANMIGEEFSLSFILFYLFVFYQFLPSFLLFFLFFSFFLLQLVHCFFLSFFISFFSFFFIHSVFIPSDKFYSFLSFFLSFYSFSLEVLFIYLSIYLSIYGGCPRGVMVKAMDCGIVVSEFVLQSRYYVHFQANTLGKGMNPLSSQLWVK